MQTLLYYFFKAFISLGLFFYTKKIIVRGDENIPKKGPILFMANHPNGLIDPLLIATSIRRKTHFLVRASVFKKPVIAKFFSWLGMMPIYRIRDGVKSLSKNEQIFEQCKNLLQNQKAILIFPEGSHLRKRTIRPLSKGFTRILFRTLDDNKDLDIKIVPVGITYQNPSFYPSKVAIHFGKPITVLDFYNDENKNESTKKIKDVVSNQLKELSVSIDDNYEATLTNLNDANVDFTKVVEANRLIKDNVDLNKSKKKSSLKLLKFLILCNSCIPYFLWKNAQKKVSEIEFVDTFRFGVNIILFPIFYSIQAYVVNLFFGSKIGIIYLLISFCLVMLYSKTNPTNTEANQ